jgi:hypothetical protein
MRARRPWGLLVVVAALVGLLAPALVAGPAAAATGRVRGAIVGPGTTPKIEVTWFTTDWTYLGATKVKGGAYSLELPVGTYRLQFTDQRPAYDTDKYAPTDVTVTVTEATTTLKNARMRTGASIGGTALVRGRPAPGARIVAANTDRNSFETTADKTGAFALGGLPPGDYSVFTYDRRRNWVGRSAYLPRLKYGRFRPVRIDLPVRAGRMVVDVYAGDSAYPGTAFVTAVSRKTGQFWTEKLSGGSVTFRGLYPGSYDLVVPYAGDYLGATVPVTGRVKSRRATFGTARLTQRGGAVSGSVVDASDPGRPLAPVSLSLYDGTGALLAQTTTASDGTFRVGGALPSGSGLSLVAQPAGVNPPYLQSSGYCRFGAVTVPGVAVTAGTTTALGQLALPRLDPGC